MSLRHGRGVGQWDPWTVGLVRLKVLLEAESLKIGAIKLMAQ